jgi:outer membrane protein W
MAFSLFWEKSGMLDSTDLRPSAGPAFTAGFDYDVSPRVVFSTEFRGCWLTAEIESEGSKWAALSLNPRRCRSGWVSGS